MCMCMYILWGAFQIHPSGIRHTHCQLETDWLQSAYKLRSLVTALRTEMMQSRSPRLPRGSPHTVTHPCVCTKARPLLVSIQNNYKELAQRPEIPVVYSLKPLSHMHCFPHPLIGVVLEHTPSKPSGHRSPTQTMFPEARLRY